MINVHLEVFQGPYELLYALIEKNKIDIYDIPIAELTEQFIAYVEAMITLDMESVSEFLLMTATLLEIKSRLLLPKNKEEEEPDPQEELVRHLVEYRLFKKISEFLDDRQVIGSKLYFREENDLPKPEYKVSELLSEVSLEQLQKVFEDLMKRQEVKPKPIRNVTISKERFSVSEKIEYVFLLLRQTKTLTFSQIFTNDSTKEEKLTTFLAILELLKMNRISVKQEGNFSELYLFENEGGQNDEG